MINGKDITRTIAICSLINMSEYSTDLPDTDNIVDMDLRMRQFPCRWQCRIGNCSNSFCRFSSWWCMNDSLVTFKIFIQILYQFPWQRNKVSMEMERQFPCYWYNCHEHFTPISLLLTRFRWKLCANSVFTDKVFMKIVRQFPAYWWGLRCNFAPISFL